MPSKDKIRRNWLKCHVCKLSIHPDSTFWRQITLTGDQVSWHSECNDKMSDSKERKPND